MIIANEVVYNTIRKQIDYRDALRKEEIYITDDIYALPDKERAGLTG